ncbi:helix-turn-helix transcriptional regulator [Nesterenkonia sp. CL21]|uniref:helix-turn-helix transcriptional regulator n=1 Tax=Nesterenkonia sp. CL21 TaxID=3064894 RepID=UPI0028795B27|nr:helix-turn-helix transcriptional regulator [Nesterenkonia sp. CL21]MDS2174309.1 helix-turn-helix transcriptional regulator [Nesterenkonia sp. CL21]
MKSSSARGPHLQELGEFLRTRRSEVQPADVGLPGGSSQRRVEGLRREEAAALALISTDYYTRIEQGRVPPSAPVLEALASALGLDDDQVDYLNELRENARRPDAQRQSGGPAARGRAAPRPQLARLLRQLTETPAIVLGPRTDILAWNRLAARLYVDFDALPTHQLNYVRLIFTDPEMRSRFADWASVARACVAILRREAAATPDDPALSKLVGELTIADPQFAHWWSARGVERQDFGTKVIIHPEVGEITLEWDIFRYAGAPEQQLVINSVDDDSPSRERLERLRDDPA